MSSTHQIRKNELYVEISDLSKKISDFAKRQEALNNDLTKSNAEIMRQSQIVTDALITGTEPAAAQEKIVRERVKVDGYNAAIAQIAKNIVDLKTQAEEKERQARLMDFFSETDTLEDQILETISALRTILGKFALAEATVREIERSNFNPAAYDHTRLMMLVYAALQAKLTSSDGIGRTLENLQSGYGAFFAQTHKQ
jgi:hypothetical protein